MPDMAAPPPGTASGVEPTVERLNDLVERFRARASPLGYFAAMYRQTTRAVGRAMAAGTFDDAERMARLVETFAGRYLDAVAAWEADRPVTRSWKVAFEAADDDDQLILQHIVLGVNAHVNLDLAIAAAITARGDIEAMEGDFNAINDILGSLTDAVQGAIGGFSPLLDVIWRVADEGDDAILGFSFRVAREEAWRRAVTLAGLPSAAWPATIDSTDRAVALVGRLVRSPHGLAGAAVSLVRHTESTDSALVIDALGSVGD